MANGSNDHVAIELDNLENGGFQPEQVPIDDDDDDGAPTIAQNGPNPRRQQSNQSVESAPDNSRRGRRSAYWYYLVQKYGQETTMHGIRYVVEPSSLFCRRVTWLLVFVVACAILTYLFAEKVKFLLSNPKNVDLDFNFNDTLPFPAVTICNESPYKLTSLHKKDLYDLMVLDRGDVNRTSTRGETFWLLPEVCSIPDSVPEQYRRQLFDVSRAVCRRMCSNVYTDHCSGFLYNRTARTCTLSPYTGNWQPPDALKNCSGLPVEFYSRNRLLAGSTITCNFENKTACALVSDWSMSERWITIKSGPRKWDTTLYKDGTGHYASMAKTDVRAGYKARLVSPYMVTTAKCLELFYWVSAVRPDNPFDRIAARVEVVAISEDMEETIIATSERPNSSDFERIFVPLPTGIHRIAIDGLRDTRRVDSALSIDDVTIMECGKFDAEKECLVNRLGRHYLGTVKKSASGKTCLKWIEGPASLVVQLPDASTVDASNYCRYIPYQNWKGPSCLVYSGSGNIEVEQCNIPYCGAIAKIGCRGASSIKCNNGMCLPRSVECNGAQYCTDGSTNQVLCAGKQNVSCKFEDPFICGYTTVPLGDLSWEHTDSRTIGFDESGASTAGARTSDDGAEEESEKTLTPIGHIMVAKSSGKYGDKLLLFSPLYTFDKPTQVTFSYYVQSYNSRTGGSLAVYLLSGHKAPVSKLFGHFDNKVNVWTAASRCVPQGTYYLMFQARLGQPFVSDIMLDNVHISYEPDDCRLKLSRKESLFNCPFNGNWCGAMLLASSAGLSATWTFPIVNDDEEDDGSYDDTTAIDQGTAVDSDRDYDAAAVVDSYEEETANEPKDATEEIDPFSNVTGVHEETATEVAYPADESTEDDDFVNDAPALDGTEEGVEEEPEYEDDRKDDEPDPEEDYTDVDETESAISTYCPTREFQSTEAVVFSPKYPTNYDNNLDCYYYINSPRRSIVTLTFVSFDVEFDEDCSFDFLNITCVNDPSISVLHCGQARPPALTVRCTRLQLHFRTDNSVNKGGFEIFSRVTTPPSTALTLDIQQTASGLSNIYAANMYFPPAELQETACLRMNFSTSSYFAVRLVYLTREKVLKERLLFRSIGPLGPGYLLWRKDIRPEMTEMEPFVVVLHTRGRNVNGALANIKSIQLLPRACNKTGPTSLHQFCSDLTCVDMYENATDRQRWFKIKLPTDQYVIKCEFEAGFAGDNGTYILSSAINDKVNVSGIKIHYKVSSPDVRIHLYFLSQKTRRVLKRNVLVASSEIFFDDEVAFGEKYIIAFHVYRDISIGTGTDAHATINSVILLDVELEDEEVGITCRFTNSIVCGYMLGEQWLYTYPELVHVSNGMNDILGNQLTTPVVTISESDGRVLEISYDNLAGIVVIEAFAANHVGHMLPVSLYRHKETSVAENLALRICLSPGEYRVVLSFLSATIGARQQIQSVRLTNDPCSLDELPVSPGPDSDKTSSFSVLSPKFAWICRTGVPVVFFAGEMDVSVVMKYDLRGKFHLSHLTSYREFNGYVIAPASSTVQLTLEVNDDIHPSRCGKLFIMVQKEDGTFDLRNYGINSRRITLFSANGKFHIKAESKMLRQECIRSIGYEVTTDSSVCKGTQVLTAVVPITEKNNMPIAEWASEVIQSGDGVTTACLTFDLELRTYTRNMMIQLIYRNSSISQDILRKTILDLSSTDWTTDRDEQLLMEIKDSLEIQLGVVYQYQIVIYFTTHQMPSDDIAAEIRLFQVRSGGCAAHGSSVLKSCRDQCGFMDTSHGQVRWLRHRHRLLTFAQDTNDVSSTIMGIPCQAWTSQSPHLHPYGSSSMASFGNICSAPDDDLALWCYTTDPSQKTEYCAVSTQIRDFVTFRSVQFDGKLGAATLMSAPLIVRNQTEKFCVRFSYQISSPTVILKVAVLQLSARSSTKPIVVSTLTFKTMLRDNNLFSWTCDLPGVERVLLIAEKVCFTLNKTEIFVKELNISEGECRRTVQDRHHTGLFHPGAPVRLPRAQYISSIYKDSKDVLMTDLIQKLGYRDRQQFITECRFQGQPCANDALQPIFTDMGLCYTFNNDANGTQISNISGVDFGLWLTINVEQYENVLGYAGEAGVLVWLHSPGDVSTAVQGLAVAPGVRALFDLSYSMSETLPAPFGMCKNNQKLRYDNSTDSYSVAKCRLECQATALNEECGCIEPYMPGPFPVCNLEKYMTCALKWRNSTGGRDYSHCQCPPSCDQTTYDATVSTSHLSELLVRSLLSSRSEVRKRYYRAREIRSRIESDQMNQLVGRLEHLTVLLERIRSVLEVDVVNVSTSVIGYLFDAVNAIVQHTEKSVVSFQTQIFEAYSSTYSRRAGFLVQQLVTCANEFVNKIVHLWIEVIDLDLTNSDFVNLAVNKSTSYAKLNETVQQASVFCTDVKFLRDNVKNVKLSSDVRNCNLADDFCSLFKKGAFEVEKYARDVEELREEFDKSDQLMKKYGTFDRYIDSDRSRVRTRTKKLRQMINTSYVLQKINCATELSGFIEEIQRWLDTATTLNESLPLQPDDRQDIFDQLNDNIAWLHSSIHAYTVGRLTQEQLSGEITSRFEQIDQVLLNISGVMLTSVEAEIQTIVDKYSTEIIETLIRLVSFLRRLSEYSIDVNPDLYQLTEQFARTLFVWRKPTPKFRRTSELGYGLKAADVRKIWPPQQSLADFSKSAAQRHIKLIIDDYLDQVLARSDQLQNDIRRFVQMAGVALDEVKEPLLEYNRSMVIRGEFIRDNFLKVKLFYGEIKYNALSQSPAYDVETLLSDLGGYLGLLIGGSALTILEIFDLVFYNAFLKMLGRR